MQDKYNQKIKDIDEKNQVRLKDRKENADKEFQNLVEKHKKQMGEIKEHKEKYVADYQQQADREIKQEKDKGDKALTQQRDVNQKNFDKTQALGEKKVADSKASYETKEQKLDEEYKKDFERKNQQWNSKVDRQDKEYNEKINHSKEEYDKQLKQQNKHFESIYQKNESNNKLSLRIQSQNYAKALAEEHRKFMTESSKYAGKEDDPFYKIQDRGNELSEDRHFYVLKAYVPEHEKDNINVIVQKDKATIATQRMFKENLNDEEQGRKISTNTAQTMREEFSFDKPIITEGIARERSGDYIFVTIPKLQSFQNRSIKG